MYPIPRAPRAFLPLAAACSAAALLLAAPAPVQAQFFGKNKVQYKTFEWSVLSTTHFDVYFYEGERETAIDAARMAERAYLRLAKVMGHEIEHKVPLVLYASHSDFQQTNITPSHIEEGTGGVTEFYKQRVFLPFTGSYAELRHVLEHELVHAFQVDILFGDGGGFVSNPFGFQPPGWLMEGSAEYLSIGGLDPHTRMWLRDAALEGYLISIQQLERTGDIRVYRFGQAICDYIGRHYGQEKIGEILRRAPDMRDTNAAIEAALGVSGERLSELWMEEVRRTYLPEIANHQKPAEVATKLTDHEKELATYNLAPEVSPKGDRFVFLSDRSLYQDIYLASTLDGKILSRLVQGERTGDLESLRFLYTSLCWSPDEKYVAFVSKSDGVDAINVLNVESKKIERRLKFPLDGLLSPSWSPDGEWIAFVGLQGGQSDLFLCRADGTDLRPLTHDRYMDRDPRWSPDGTKLAFTTDRDVATNFQTLNFIEPRVAIYDLAAGTSDVLPAQEGKNLNPCWSPDGAWVAYLSDRTGISNIFVSELATGDVYLLTDVLTGVTGVTSGSPALSWSAGGDRMVFCAYTQGGYDIFTIKNPLQGKKPYDAVRDEVVAAREPAPAPREPAAGTPTAMAAADTLLPGGATDPGGSEEELPEFAAAFDPGTAPEFATVMLGRSDAGAAKRADGAGEAAEGDSAAVAVAPVDSLPDPATFEIAPYRTRFTRDFSVGGAAFASNVGLAGQTALGFSDILGNHNFFIAASVFGSLTDSDLLFSYTNLAQRTNYGFALFQYRNDYYVRTPRDGDEYQSNVYRGAQLAFARPFNRFVRAEWSVEAVAVSESVFREWYFGRPRSVEERGTRFYFTPTVALVTDNVLYGMTGPISGSRSRYEIGHSLGEVSNTTTLVDTRHYKNIKQRYVFATRAIAAASTGADPVAFRVGGPFTFRGVDWGELAGSRVAIANAEFRYPLIDRLRLVWPLALDFRGIQGVLFTEGAAAWNEGNFRFWRDGGLDSPLLAYGAGARMNLGYFILRWDIAQATNLKHRVDGTRHFFTIGGDF